jgi:oxygen-independent coproporphyrinogen-3 oxidase
MAGEKMDRMVETAPNSLGIYLSVPFCRAKCTYCNFASGVYPASEHARYVERMIAELECSAARSAELGLELPRTVDTIYFGGGTPVLLDGALFTEIFRAIRRNFAVHENAEITVECAPGQLSDSTLAAMVDSGVNRVSLGVQSFVDREASLSGRLHTRRIVFEDLRRLRAAGIGNLNIDLLAGLAEQTFASWRESLAVLVEAETPHASVYMLEVDEDSRLGRELIAGGARYSAGLVPTDDAIAQMYEEAVETLAAAGLAQYEISNLARPGFESAHNLRYWQRRPYLGVGLDASSMLQSGDGSVLRTTTTDDLSSYLDGTGSLETAWLGPVQQLEEAWFLGLRRNAGVSIEDIRGEFGFGAVESCMEVVARLVGDGLLFAEGGRVRLTDRGRMISNDVFAEFLGLRAQVEEGAAQR